MGVNGYGGERAGDAGCMGEREGGHMSERGT